MNYDITIEYKDGRVSMKFLGVDFFALDKVFGTMPIKNYPIIASEFSIQNRMNRPIFSHPTIISLKSYPYRLLIHTRLLSFSGVFRTEKIFQYIS